MEKTKWQESSGVPPPSSPTLTVWIWWGTSKSFFAENLVPREWCYWEVTGSYNANLINRLTVGVFILNGVLEGVYLNEVCHLGVCLVAYNLSLDLLPTAIQLPRHDYLCFQYLFLHNAQPHYRLTAMTLPTMDWNVWKLSQINISLFVSEIPYYSCSQTNTHTFSPLPSHGPCCFLSWYPVQSLCRHYFPL